MAKSRLFDGRIVTLQEHLFDTEKAALEIFRHDSRFLHNWLSFFKLAPESTAKYLLNLRLTCLFHDIGKANTSFQNAVLKTNTLPQAMRHEHLSAFILHLPEIRDWLSKNSDVDLPLLTSAVLCHHLKASSDKEHRYKWGLLLHRLPLHLQHAEVQTTLARIHLVLGQLGKVPELSYPYIDFSEPHWKKLRGYAQREATANRFKLQGQRKQMHLALKAGLIVADSVSSGLVREGEDILDWVSDVIHCDAIAKDEVYQKIIAPRMHAKKIPGLRDFQLGVAEKGSRVFLMAACGMGKTLAAWNWANEIAKQRTISKVIFLYPTRGTASEGFKDYASWAPEADAALMHGSAKYELESMFSNPGEPKNKADFSLSEAQERLYALGYWSKRFFSATAEQFLSFLENNYRGMCLLPVLSECALILDEVHSYDKKMFQSLLDFLQHFELPVLCMTATLTTKRKQSLLEKGLIEYPQSSERQQLQELQDSEQHPRYDKTILNGEDAAFAVAVQAFQSGKRVLWVVNTVARCQELYQKLYDNLEQEVHCYHSRFKLGDRKNVHRKTIAAFQGAAKTSIAVTTQVCEMSLDLDADVLISEFAPVSSLVQRFGRANRHLSKGEEFRAELYVYKPVSDAPYTSLEIEQGEKFLQVIPEKDISQKLLAETLEQFAEEYKIQEYSSFTNGYYAIPDDYRDIEEFTTQAILQEDFAQVIDCLERNKPYDEYLLPVPNKDDSINIRSDSSHAILPKYLWVVNERFYHPTKGFQI
ncbi:MAG: CRISPR-associated helicase Cas3' [Spirochaetota bacterium]